MNDIARLLRIALVAGILLGGLPFLARGQSSGVLREVWTGISGVTVADLTNSVNYPDSPNTEEVLSSFEAPTDVMDNYGQRLMALVTAPQTGNYVFWIASDDYSALYLSTDATPANKRVIASVPGWTSSRAWTWYSEQQSASISLVAGQSYYIEALMKEEGGGDNLAVRWQLPNTTMEEPIPGSRLQVYGLGPPEITQQPSDATVTEGGTATFTVQLQRSVGTTYQWLRSGTNIPGADRATYWFGPVTLADHNVQFSCAITNSQGSTNTRNALLTVQADTIAPTITSVVNLGDATLVTVLYSEPVEPASATNRLNYGINNGVTVNSASFAGDTQTIVLRTTTMSAGITYTLTVNHVRDRASVANTIAANTQRAFTFDHTPADIADLTPARETLGPSTRRAGLVISEIMYHPTNRTDGRVLEFIELYNSQVYAEEISGYRLTGEIDYTFPANTTIAAGAYLVVAPVPADVQAVYGISGVRGGFTNRLSNGSGTVRLRNKSGAVLLEANYSGDPPWPVAADGAGHSLVLARPTFGEGNPEAWAASDLVGGTPGAAETTGSNPYRTIVLNEYLAHTDLPDIDFIELYNYGGASVSLAGCIITDDPTTNRFVIPSGVTIPGKGFLSYNSTALGFMLDASGETLYLMNPAHTRVIDVVRFKGQGNGVSTGRSPDGAPAFWRLSSKTAGASNSQPLVSDVVINEVMYRPVWSDSDNEFVELYNHSGALVSLAGWRLSDGISFTFPTNAVISAGGYVVVANNATHLITNYTGLSTNNTFGDYGGTLADGGERIALSMPDQIVSTNGGFLVTNTIHIVMDEVTYRDGGRWGRWSDGGGSSLERIDPWGDPRLASNWGDSDESAKSPWVTVEHTGTLDHGSVAADAVQIFLQGEGECLVDNIEVIPQGGSNLVPNPTFEAGLGGWLLQGTHDMSSLENSGGYGGGRCLHIRASSRGDTGANRVQAALTSSPGSGTVATLRARVRWLKGNPEILLRFRGNWLEAYTNIVAAHNLGTPGAANSRAASNAGPAIYGVTHTPAVPAASQAVTVRAQVNDPDGLASLVLKYRIDPSTNYSAMAMAYRGAGLYTATLPGQAANTLVAFYLQALDGHAQATLTTFPSDPPARECLVRFGETIPSTGRVGTYRFWITQATNQRWTSREKNSNEPLDATFVYGTNRVVYNLGTLYSGSPWHTGGYNGPTGNICDYVLHFPKDDLMLGCTDYVMASTGNLNSDDTAQAEQAAFWMIYKLDAPTLYRRHVNLFVNGSQRGLIYEDAQQPGGDVVDEWWPDHNQGDLHKIEDWFEFNDTGDSFTSQTDATLQDFTTTGGQKKLARYRWTFRKRAVKDSANDYANLFTLVDALNSNQPEPYTSLTEAEMDIEEWCRIIAVEHIVGNWDSYGYNRGKNLYAYRPDGGGKWHLLPWDIDFVLDKGGDGTSTVIDPTDAGFPVNDGVMRTFLSFAPVQRAFWRALEDAVNGPMASANISAMMNAKYNGLTAAGIPVASPANTLTWIADRRTFIQGELATVAASFALTLNGGNNFSTNRNYLTLTGTAPIGVTTIEINGIAYPVTWTGLTTWTLNYALDPGANSLTLQGYDLRGNPISGSSDTIMITYTGTSELPQDMLVINEIMYNAALPDTGFIEIHNRSTVNAFNLSNYRLNGADFTFDEGTIIQPGAYLVLVRDRSSFIAAYGSSLPITGVYNGTLDNGGETLQLIEPGVTPDLDVVIDEVSYDDDPPWPIAADGFGPSLQLIDSSLDNNRVANWAAVTNSGPTPSAVTNNLIRIDSAWRYDQSDTDRGDTWRDNAYNDASWQGPGAGLLAYESAALPEPIRTQLSTNYNRITFYYRTHFPFTNDPARTTLYLRSVLDDGAVFYLNGHRFHALGMDTNQPISYFTTATRTIEPAAYEGPFAFAGDYLQNGDNVLAVEVHQINATSSDIVFGMTLTSVTQPPGGGTGEPYTPGAANSVGATLTAFPRVWLNEVQPNNVTGPQDRMGDRDPWVELYNSEPSAADLTGYYLSDTYTNLTRWPFPAGFTLTSGQFDLVWLDNEPGETGGGEQHANFRASSTNGSVVLTRVSGSTTTIVDYLNWSPINNDRSYGAWPDGTPARRQKFYYATPGAPNTNAYPAFPIAINEWMASNPSTLPDPVDGDFEDWFELYNGGPTAVDLSGFTLTDDTNNPAMWTIPDGTVIPGESYLLVWADDEQGQNGYGGSDLHAEFKLSATADAIALYAPNGTNIDLVSFNQQTNNISQGRWPDGNSTFYFMIQPTPRAPNTIGDTNNVQPTLNPIGSKSGSEGTLITFTASATDPNAGQTLTFSLDPGAPTNAAINPSSGAFTWTPTEAQGPGSHNITIRVRDNGSPALSDSEAITILVSEVNTAPTLAAIPDQTATEGPIFSLATSAQDTDLPLQTLTYSLDVGAPANATIGPNGVFTWTPSEAQGPGTYSVTIIVTDSGSPALNAARTFHITVSEVNTAPTLVDPPDTNINEAVAWTYNLSASDPDLPAQTLTYSLISGPTGLTVSGTGLVSWTPSEAQGPSTNPVTVRVTDNGTGNLNASQSFRIVVNEVNSAPALVDPPDTNLNEAVAWTYNLSASDPDLPAQTLTHSLISGPTGLTVSGTGLVSWNPSEAQGPSTNTVSVRVTDNGTGNLNASQTFTLRVAEVNTAPTLAVIADQSVTAGSLLTVPASASDTDQPANTLTFSLTGSVPNGAVIDPSSGVFTWTPSTNQAPSTNAVTVQVTDNGLPVMSANRTFTVIVSSVTTLRITAITTVPVGSVTLTWASQAGKTYRIEYQGSLATGTWTELGNYSATGNSTSATDPSPGTSQRFYRVVQTN